MYYSLFLGVLPHNTACPFVNNNASTSTQHIQGESLVKGGGGAGQPNITMHFSLKYNAFS